MKNWKLNVAVMAMMGATTISCEKEIMNLATNTYTASEQSSVQMTVSSQSMDSEIDAVSFNSRGISMTDLEQRLPQGVKITDSGADVYPRTITIDFGTGITDNNGRVKSGKIIVSMTNDMTVVGAVRTVKLDDFKVDDLTMNGLQTMTNLQMNGVEPVFEMKDEMSMTDKEGMETTQVNEGTKTWIEGFGDDDMSNDIFTMEGTAKMRNSNMSMVKTILRPLVINRSCKHIVQGVIEMNNNGEVSSIDFGNGDCDSKAVLTKNGETIGIDLDNMCGGDPKPQDSDSYSNQTTNSAS